MLAGRVFILNLMRFSPNRRDDDISMPRGLSEPHSRLKHTAPRVGLWILGRFGSFFCGLVGPRSRENNLSRLWCIGRCGRLLHSLARQPAPKVDLLLGRRAGGMERDDRPIL